MPFRIQKRVPRGQKNTVGIHMDKHREALARAAEAASLIPYTLYHSGALAAGTTPVGITPIVGAKAESVLVHVGAVGTGTVDVQVDGVSILTAVIDVNGATAGTILEGTLTAAAKEALAAKKRVTVVLTAGTASAITVDLHLKSVHAAVFG